NPVVLMRYLARSASSRSVATTPKSPREIGVGVVMPREMKGDMLSWSKVRQTMCRVMAVPFLRAHFRRRRQGAARYRRAAIDRNGGAGDIGSLVRAEKQHGIG